MGTEWVTVLGTVIAAQPRIRGPEHRQMAMNPDGSWSLIRWEYRGGAWHEEVAQATDQVGTVNGLDRHPPLGVKVSRPGSRARQVELSHRTGVRVAADPEGYAR